MANYLLIDGDGLVTNAVVWDGETQYAPDEALTLVEQPGGVGVGWRRDGETWIALSQPEEDI